MTRSGILKILSTLKTAYPNFYKGISKEEAENTVNLWQEMFKNENLELVMLAIKELIETFKFPPTIADVKAKIVEIKENERKSMWEDLYDN